MVGMIMAAARVGTQVSPSLPDRKLELFDLFEHPRKWIFFFLFFFFFLSRKSMRICISHGDVTASLDVGTVVGVASWCQGHHTRHPSVFHKVKDWDFGLGSDGNGFPDGNDCGRVREKWYWGPLLVSGGGDWGWGWGRGRGRGRGRGGNGGLLGHACLVNTGERLIDGSHLFQGDQAMLDTLAEILKVHMNIVRGKGLCDGGGVRGIIAWMGPTEVNLLKKPK